MMHTQVEPTAVELHYGEDARLLTVLLEHTGRRRGEGRAASLLNPFGEVRTLSDEETVIATHQRPLRTRPSSSSPPHRLTSRTCWERSSGRRSAEGSTNPASRATPPAA